MYLYNSITLKGWKLMSKRMTVLKDKIELFLENHSEGDVLHLYIAKTEKEQVETILKNHPVGKNFKLVIGIFKPGHLEHDYIIQPK